MPRKMLRIEAPHFVAGAVFDLDPFRCIDAAPILRWMVGKPPRKSREYVERKRWGFCWIDLPGES